MLVLVADDVSAIVVDQNIRHLREAVIVLGLVRIGRVGLQQVRVHVRQRCLEARVGVDQVVDLAVVAGLDEGAELQSDTAMLYLFSPDVSEVLRRVS